MKTIVICFVCLILLGLGMAVGQDGGRKLFATLTGAAEVPGPGDPDGSGTGTVTLNQGKGQVCFELTVANIAPANVAHIHEGNTNQAGPPVVTLAPPPTNGASNSCLAADAELIKRIRQNPENFYINVHTADFPNGAVRGQLTKKE
jgi:hypothetical protein